MCLLVLTSARVVSCVVMHPLHIEVFIQDDGKRFDALDICFVKGLPKEILERGLSGGERGSVGVAR